MDADPEIVADSVLVIGRQVPTSYGTVADLLGIDANGNLVVIELKRNRTLRETVAQALEYAAWASKLPYDKVTAIGTDRFGSLEQFGTAFEQKFGEHLPISLNDSQRILLVAPEITDSTAAVIEYLSESFDVPLDGVSFDGVSFDAFGLDGRLVLVRHFVREEPFMEPTRPGKKRTLEQFVAAAHENGVGELVEHLLTMRDVLPGVDRYLGSFALMATAPDHRRLAAFSVYPTKESNPNSVHLVMSPTNLSALYSLSAERCAAFIQEIQSLGTAERGWEGWVKIGFTSLKQVQEFDRRFRAFVAQAKAQRAAGAVEGQVPLVPEATDDVLQDLVDTGR